MTRNIYTLLSDVEGQVYVRLLDHSLDCCDSFILVTRHSIVASASAMAVLDRLEPYLVCAEESSEWPGTQLLGSTARVYRYKLTSDTIFILGEVAERLFDWQQPELPEDLCLIRPDGNPWLVTIAHEEDAYLNLSNDERAALTESIPILSLQLDRGPSE
jgi:hypothetical protein